MTDLDGPRAAPASGKAATSVVVLLHGLGADGNDLISIAPIWASALLDTAFVAPNAPFPCDMAPFGRQWFSLQSRDPVDMVAGIRAVADSLNAFLDAELARHGLSPDRLALMGFSQGTMTSLYVAPRRAAPVAGILGYSGALVHGDVPSDPITARPPVCLIHGTADDVVPFSSMVGAETALRDANLEVESFPRPGLGHGIDEVGLGVGLAFLRRVLSA
jgi:phospholipase/carboxylesterase